MLAAAEYAAVTWVDNVAALQNTCFLPTSRARAGLGLPGNYSFVKRLGEGAQGQVWLAVNNDTNELVAVKVCGGVAGGRGGSAMKQRPAGSAAEHAAQGPRVLVCVHLRAHAPAMAPCWLVATTVAQRAHALLHAWAAPHHRSCRAAHRRGASPWSAERCGASAFAEAPKGLAAVCLQHPRPHAG